MDLRRKTSRWPGLVLLFLVLGLSTACGDGGEATPASCSYVVLNDEYDPTVPWLRYEEDHGPDGRLLEARMFNDEYSSTTVWRRWQAEYAADLLAEIRVFDDEYSATTPWLVTTYEDVPASATAGCPTDFPLPGWPSRS